jgi:hypothetical protein
MYQKSSQTETVSLNVMFAACGGSFRVVGVVRGVVLSRLRRAFA